jgi:hypothetical protein
VVVVLVAIGEHLRFPRLTDFGRARSADQLALRVDVATALCA